jgi:hypothetical protein
LQFPEGMKSIPCESAEAIYRWHGKGGTTTSSRVDSDFF